MARQPKRRVVAISAAIVIMAAAAVATATASSKKHAAKLHATPNQTVSVRLIHMLKVLREDRARAHVASADTSSQELPQAVVKGLSGSRPGVDTSAAVFAGGTYPVWVVPGSTEVCLINGSTGPGDVPGGLCSPTSEVSHGLAVSDGSIVFGLVPDGNTSVKVTNSDGTTESVPVVNNVYEITSGDPSTVTLKEASGVEVTRHLP